MHAPAVRQITRTQYGANISAFIPHIEAMGTDENTANRVSVVYIAIQSPGRRFDMN